MCWVCLLQVVKSQELKAQTLVMMHKQALEEYDVRSDDNVLFDLFVVTVFP